jgi:hypothetical protein
MNSPYTRYRNVNRSRVEIHRMRLRHKNVKFLAQDFEILDKILAYRYSQHLICDCLKLDCAEVFKKT